MKFSLGISNFPNEFSCLSHSIVFLHALITEEGFLILPCYCLELCFQMGISFLFSDICKPPSNKHFAFLHFFFLWMDLITACYKLSRTSIRSSSSILSIKSHPLTTLPLNILYLHHGKKGSGPQQRTHTKNPNRPSTERPSCVFCGLSALTDFSSPHPWK